MKKEDTFILDVIFSTGFYSNYGHVISDTLDAIWNPEITWSIMSIRQHCTQALYHTIFETWGPGTNTVHSKGYSYFCT